MMLEFLRLLFIGTCYVAGSLIMLLLSVWLVLVIRSILRRDQWPKR